MTASEQIIQVIDALCKKFGIVINWTSGNVLPYLESLCQKLIAYEICSSIALIVIMVLIGLGCIIATKKFYPIFKNGWRRNAESYDDCGWQVASVLAILGLITLSIVILGVLSTQIINIIKCSIFPEMYIFEYISSLINSVQG